MKWRGPIGGGAASGAVGAYVASHNKGGQYLRARTTPTNPSSSFQVIVRNGVKSLSNRWQTVLTSAQRSAWSVYASNVPVLNTLGDSINLTGMNMYVRSNTPRVQGSMAIVDDAPVDFNLGSATTPTLTLGAGTSTGTLTYAAADFVGNANASTSMLLYTSRPQARSIIFFKGPYRFAGKILGTATGPSATFTLPFANGGTNNIVYGQIRISRSDGRLTSTFPFSGNPA